jgi:hypothetical protein
VNAGAIRPSLAIEGGRSMSKLALIVTLCACSKPVAFQGQTAMSVVGTPPAAPVAEAPPPPRVEVRDNKIEIHDKIQFD